MSKSQPSRDPATTPVVVAACRTAIGRAHPERGLFRHVRGDELATAVVRAAVERSGVDPGSIEDLVLGATQQRGELGGNVARCVALMADLLPLLNKRAGGREISGLKAYE
jgi:acetyl-CoA acyltransferase